MPHRMKHGVILPAHRVESKAPARVVNVRSRSRENNSRIRLDRLLRSARPKICIKRRLGGIGDVIMSTPLIKAIKMLIPNCHLIYATDMQYAQGSLGDVIRHCPFVDELIPNSEINESEYDYSVDITSTGLNRERGGTIPPNRIDMFAEAAGVDISADPVPVYIVTPEERKQAEQFIEETIPGRNKDTKIIGVQVRSNDARRTWPLHYMQELCDMLAEKENTHVFMFDWGSTVGKWVGGDRKHLILDMPWVEASALIDQCDVIICPDSSILHLAGALQKKIVTIFGPIPPQSRINYYANATAVVKHLPCSFCWYTPRCAVSNQTLDCLNGIKPQEVLEAVEKKLIEPHRTISNVVYGKDLTNKNQDPVILVKRSTSGLGDLLMVTPAIDALKAKYKNKEIHVACQRGVWPVLQNNPSVSKILDINDSFNLKRYYMVIDVSTPCARYESARIGSGRKVQKSRVEVFAEAMGVRDMITTLKPRYYPTQEELEWGKETLDTYCKSDRPRIAIGLRSAELYRDWPEENYEKLFKLLEDYFELILIDHSRTNMYPNVVDISGSPLRKKMALMSLCDGLISVDTGLVHYAAAMELPTIAMFGPIDYKARCKGYDLVTVIMANMDCIPCWRNAQMPCKQKGMIKCYSECMEKISPKHIASVAIKKFKVK